MLRSPPGDDPPAPLSQPALTPSPPPSERMPSFKELTSLCPALRQTSESRHWHVYQELTAKNNSALNPPPLTTTTSAHSQASTSAGIYTLHCHATEVSFLSAPEHDIAANKWQRRQRRERPMHSLFKLVLFNLGNNTKKFNISGNTV